MGSVIRVILRGRVVRAAYTRVACRRPGAPGPATASPIFGCLLALYSLILLECQQNLMLGNGPFLQKHHLVFWEKSLFCLTFSVEIIVLVVTLSAVLRWVASFFIPKLAWTASIVVASGYFAAVTVQYRVLRYLRDGISLAVVRSLGGGSLSSALGYIRDELAGVGALLVLAVIVCVAAGYAVRYWARLRPAWGGVLTCGSLFSSGRLLAANAVLVGIIPVLALATPDLHEVLGYSLAHSVYSAPAEYLTDFDGDGYGMISSPPDFAPFDASRHPYAIEIPGNGVDEDGIGGDLAEVIPARWPRAWDAAKLNRRNVLLIVLESARYDLLDQDVDGQPAMPGLRSLPGERLSVFSHTGYTTTSLLAAMTGALVEHQGISLIDRFRALGYQTGVFSAQAEDFGGMAALCNMRSADVFVDASSLPRESRMHTSTELGAIGVPAPVVRTRFVEWLRRLDQRKSFFAYLNFQEMHFPYYYPTGPTPLIHRPIPRGDILPENKEWLRRTYLNAARCVDSAISDLVSALRSAGCFENTAILVVGDHGEELFDHGNLGHGTSTSYEQNQVVAKLVNSAWKPPNQPLGSADVGSIIHNALVASPVDALPVGGDVLCYTGDIHKPAQVALATAAGLVKYDFRRNSWLKQAHQGADFAPSGPEYRVIYVWESLLVEEAARRGRSATRLSP